MDLAMIDGYAMGHLLLIFSPNNLFWHSINMRLESVARVAPKLTDDAKVKFVGEEKSQWQSSHVVSKEDCYRSKDLTTTGQQHSLRDTLKHGATWLKIDS